MACQHKFIDYLDLSKIDFSPTTLIVGTFNPKWPKENVAEWFYGRTENNYFWEVLPRIYAKQSLITSKPTDWKRFCKENQIAITDLISTINDAHEDNYEHEELLSTYSDLAIANTFKDYSTGHIKVIFQKYPSLRFIYFTRRGQGKLWKKLWKLVEAECSSKGIVHIKELLTPSKYARFQFGKSRNTGSTNALCLEDYILERWKSVWHPIILLNEKLL